MKFNKSDYIHYLNCPQSLWVQKNILNSTKKREINLYQEKLIREGYEVEELAKSLFPNSVEINAFEGNRFTNEQLQNNSTFYFQPTFETEQGFIARVDVLEVLNDGTYHIIEIKSASSIKSDNIIDARFQKFVLEQCGFQVSKVSILHLNAEYIREKEIDVLDLFTQVDITDEVEKDFVQVNKDILEAFHYIQGADLELLSCNCKYSTKSHHCESFQYFNPDLPKYSIYELARISRKKIERLVEQNIFKINDIPDDFSLSTIQKLQVESKKNSKPIIQRENIKQTLDKLTYPLHFIDYETFCSAIPKIDKLSPHKHLVFQVSIHTLQEDGTLEHFEWLANDFEFPNKMLAEMKEFIGTSGTFISWNKSFEIGRNNDLIKWLPQYEDYLTKMNEKMFDLQDIFKTDYVDYQFRGSTSIKKVLPVLCPQLSYNDLDVQDGTMAMVTWENMISDYSNSKERDLIRQSLLEYCKLDSLAMVEIYAFLRNL